MTYNTIEAVKEVLYEQARKPEGGVFRMAAVHLTDERYQAVATKNLSSKREVLQNLGLVFVEK